MRNSLLLSFLAWMVLWVSSAWAEGFTYVVLPDTQKYTLDYPLTFGAQTQWVVDSKDALNIVFLSHLGDLVENRNEVELQWKTADSAMSRLDGVVPYGMAPGNHDLNWNRSGLGRLYDHYFPASRYRGQDDFGGSYFNNRSNYHLISAGGLDLIFLHLDYDPPDHVLAWANQVLADHATRRAIVTTHLFLDPGSGQRSTNPFDRPDGNSGEEIWSKLIRPNCNVFLVLNGHYASNQGEDRRTDSNNCGEVVHQVVQDYQGRPNGGNGLLRYYTFVPDQDEIHAFTYSPTLDFYEVDSGSQFVLDYDMTP